MHCGAECGSVGVVSENGGGDGRHHSNTKYLVQTLILVLIAACDNI